WLAWRLRRITRPWQTRLLACSRIGVPYDFGLPVGHTFAQARQVRLRGLAQMPLVTIGHQLHPEFYSTANDICVQRGFSMENVQDVTTFTEAAGMVAENLGFTFACPGHAGRHIPALYSDR